MRIHRPLRIILPALLLALVRLAVAQPGGWQVDPKNFQFSMSMVVQIETGGAPNQAPGNHLAAFSGNQIRGYAKPVQIGNQAYYFLNIYANTYLNDTLYFQAFIGADNRVYESMDTVIFLHHKLVGDLQNPFILHFELSPRPLIYSLANINYAESACNPGPLIDVQASDDQDSEGNGLKYAIVGGADSSKFRIDSLTGILNWKNFTPDFEHPADADSNNTYLVSVEVSDAQGNRFVQTITVSVKDDPPPAATCPPALTANTSDDDMGDCTTSVTGNLAVGIPANCATYHIAYQLSGATTGQGTGQIPPGQLFAGGKTTAVYTVTDESGTLSKTCSFSVTVADNEVPVLTCPGAITIQTDYNSCTATPVGTALTVADNCSPYQTAYQLSGAVSGTGQGQLPANQAFPPGVTTVTYSVTDNDGQSTHSCSFSVTVNDVQLPALTCPGNISSTLSSGCNTTLAGTAATASDNCTNVALSYLLSGATTGSGNGQLPGGLKFQAGETTVVYTASDGANQVSCSFTVRIKENVKPSLSCPANSDLIFDGSCTAALPNYRATAQFGDNCTADSALLFVQQPAAGAILSNPGPQTVQLTVTDLSGNSRSCAFTVTVKDSPNLRITCPPNQTVCNGLIGDYKSLAVVTTGCSGNGTPPVSQMPAPGATIPVYNGQTTVTLSATDGIRNSSCTFTVTWKDETPPAAVCKNAAVSLQAGGQAAITVADIDNNSTDNCGVQNRSLNSTSFNCNNLGVNTVVLTVTDVNGLSSTCTATVTVNDPNTYCCAPPQAVCKTNPVITLDNTGQAVIALADINNGSSFECGLQSIGVQPNTLNCSHVSAPLTVTLTVTDQKGATSTCSASVTARDAAPPQISCPPDQTVNANANCTGAVGSWQPASVSDLCTAPGAISLSQNPLANASISGHGTMQTVVLTATDASLNTATCSFTVMLKDETPPSVSCKNFAADLQQIPFVGSQAVIVANDVMASAADNCGPVNLAVSPNTFTCAHIGQNTVTLTASDQQGLTSTCQATVTVRDVTPPKITCPANQVVPADAGCSGQVGAWIATSKSDNCTPSGSVSVMQSPGSSTPLSGHNDARTVTLTATDASANTATCSFTVTLTDVSPPHVVCKNASVNLDNSGSGSLNAATVFSSGSDNCGTVNPVSVTPATFNCANLGAQVVTLLVNDGHGNTATCSASVQIVDTQKPVFTYVPPAVTVQCNAIPGPGTATATDNCGATVRYDGQMIEAGNCPGNYAIVRMWTATDGSNNTQTATQRITVQDTQAPVFTAAPVAVTVECSSIPAVGTPEATDNCDPSVTITYGGQSITPGACADSYVLTRQWIAADHCGNTRTATQRITVRDTKAPLFTSVPAAITVECSNIPGVGTPSATDNCDTQVAIDYLGGTVAQGACPNSYVLTRRWRATDNCGNTRTASQKITVRDRTKPVFTSVPASVTLECSDAVPAVGAPTATDNCDASVTITYLGQNGIYQTCVNTHQLVRTWRATDNCGNSTTATQVITVQDTRAPVFTSVPQPVTIECSDLVPPIGTPVATDACAGYVQITFLGQASTAGNCPYSYAITRTWRAQDECGNSVTASQLITVQDTQAPVFNSPPPAMMVNCDNIPSVPILTAQDNCGPATVTYQGQTQTPGDCEMEYTITRGWTAADVCGNIRTLSQTIVVLPSSPFGPGGENRGGSAARVSAFVVRPNPTTDWLTFDLGEFTGERVRLAIYDLPGKLVWEQQLDASRERSVRMSLRQVGLVEGLYTALIESPGFRQTRLVLLTR